MSKKILVIAAHPDDEVLGCGATMARHAQLGDEVHVAILAEGITSRDKTRDRERDNKKLMELQQSASKANEFLGAASVTFLAFPDNRMDTIALLDVVKAVETLILEREPDIIYTHYSGDLNIDHQVVSRAVLTACRPLPNSKIKTVLFFEVPSSTEWQSRDTLACFMPNWFVDVSDTIQLKLQALQFYKSEMRDWPHSRSLEAVRYLANWRGATNGMDAAEAFVVGRHIVNE